MAEAPHAAAAASAASAAPPHTPAEWWRALADDEVDPFSLEPLCELPYPPFVLAAAAAGADADAQHQHRFDGALLAEYLVVSRSFAHPLCAPAAQPAPPRRESLPPPRRRTAWLRLRILRTPRRRRPETAGRASR